MKTKKKVSLCEKLLNKIDFFQMKDVVLYQNKWWLPGIREKKNPWKQQKPNSKD